MPRKRIEITTEPEIKELKRGGFSVRFRIPAHDGMPESKSKWKKFPDAKRIGEIRSGIEAYKEELENEINDYVTNPGVTLGVYARRWHEDRKGEVKSSTWVRERSYITTIENSNLAKIPIGEITPEDIDQFKLDGQKAGWSKYKQRRSLEKLKYIMKFAESRHVIQSDPSRSVKGLKAENPKRRYLPEKEQKKLLTALDKEPKDGPRAAVRIALATGFREGECLGLQWQDLHLAAGGRSYIALRRQLSRNGELDMPKNDEIGDIPIDDDTAAWLADWKKTVLKKSGKSKQELQSMPVCCNTKWNYLTHTNFARWWRKFAVDHGLGTFGTVYTKPDKSGKNHKHRIDYDGFKFHELRHTTATELLSTGADLKTVQTIMRHKSIRSTEPYLHSVDDHLSEAMEKMAKRRREYAPEKEARIKEHKPSRYSAGSALPHNPKWD